MVKSVKMKLLRSPLPQSFLVPLMLALFAPTNTSWGGGVSLSSKEAAAVGRKVWQNECSGTVEGLTSWNTGENFASLGIGHFIWYPAGLNGPFKESFPALVDFLQAGGVRLPSWLTADLDCPWRSREEFRADFNGPRLTELRRLLADTVPQQTQFLIKRLDQSLGEMAKAAATSREKVERQFARVAATPQGVYSLIDYVNFKGEGVLATERYKGEGWGLLQVLEQMKGDGEAVADFSRSASEVLSRRVRNAPPERKEERWLPGWRNRVAAYAQ